MHSSIYTGGEGGCGSNEEKGGGAGATAEVFFFCKRKLKRKKRFETMSKRSERTSIRASSGMPMLVGIFCFYVSLLPLYSVSFIKEV
jgi:hypothetical protein